MDRGGIEPPTSSLRTRHYTTKPSAPKNSNWILVLFIFLKIRNFDFKNRKRLEISNYARALSIIPLNDSFDAAPTC